MNGITTIPGDCRDVLANMPADSIDACVTDPPYELAFMGRGWDSTGVAFDANTWRAVLRVLRPGAHMLAFGGTRTSHRMVCAIEDAGFEVRDTLCWLYGSGFPKSLDVSKAIDRAAGAEREVVGIDTAKAERFRSGLTGQNGGWDRPWMHEPDAEIRKAGITAPATPDAQRWNGWGTALKPSHEDIILAQKPYDLSQLCGILAQRIVGAICLLPSYARDAEANSRLSRSVFGEGFGSALWNAVAGCNTPADLCALMATLPSEWAMPSSLNTALSWLDTLGAICSRASTFTTETASSLTTDLRTLNCSRLLITPEAIIQAATRLNGTESNACIAGRIFSAVALRLEIIRDLSAAEPVLRQAAICSLAEADRIAPNHEPIVLARKPLIGTVAANVLAHGTGALNVDATRIGTDGGCAGAGAGAGCRVFGDGLNGTFAQPVPGLGRFPANVLHDGSPEVEAAFGDADGASRYFYCAKADSADRADSRHPTVKPVDLMRWLVRLITPPGGTVLDPFAGSGTTGEAAMLEGMRAVLIEQDAQHVADIRHRQARWSGQDLPLFTSWPPAEDPADTHMADLFAGHGS